MLAMLLAVPGCGSGSTASRSRAQVVSLLGVLRRPQVASDRANVPTTKLRGPTCGFHPDSALVRRAADTSWGARVFVVPLRPARCAPCTGTERACAAPPPRVETVAVLADTTTPATANAYTAAEIRSGAAVSVAGHVQSGGRDTAQLVMLVPDGVSRVSLVYPRLGERGQPGASPLIHLVLPVYENAVAWQVDAYRQAFVMTWYGPSGQVVKSTRLSAGPSA